MREISVACNIPLTAILRHLNWLEARGYVIRDHTTRSIRPLKPLLTDEDLVYTYLVRSIKVNGLAPSIDTLRQACRLLPSRVKAALQALEQAGRVRPDPEDPRLFYPVDTRR
jgi:DNA-binding IclR family transcriptional regulator